MEEIVAWSLERVGCVESLIYNLPRDREMVSVGRQAADLICNGKTVSRFHSQLIFKDNAWHVVDLRSMNKVFINGTAIVPNEPTCLKEGDLVGFGAVEAVQPEYFVFKVRRTVINASKLQGAATPASPLGNVLDSPIAASVTEQLLQSLPTKSKTSKQVVVKKEIQSPEPLNQTVALFTASNSLNKVKHSEAGLQANTASKQTTTITKVVAKPGLLGSASKPLSGSDQLKPPSSVPFGTVIKQSVSSVTQNSIASGKQSTGTGKYHSDAVSKDISSSQHTPLASGVPSVVDKSAASTEFSKIDSCHSSAKEMTKLLKDANGHCAVVTKSSSVNTVSDVLKRKGATSISTQPESSSKAKNNPTNVKSVSKSEWGRNGTPSSDKYKTLVKKFRLKECLVSVEDIGHYLGNKKCIDLKKTQIPSIPRKKVYRRLICASDSDSEPESEHELARPRRSRRRPSLLNSDDEVEDEARNQPSSLWANSSSSCTNFAPLVVPKIEKPDADSTAKGRGECLKKADTSNPPGKDLRKSLTPEQMVAIIVHESNDEQIDIVKNEPDDGPDPIPPNWMDLDNDEQSDDDIEQLVVKPNVVKPTHVNRQKSTTQSGSFIVERLVPVQPTTSSNSTAEQPAAGPSFANLPRRGVLDITEEHVSRNGSSLASYSDLCDNRNILDEDEENGVALSSIFPTFKREEESNSCYGSDSDIFILDSEEEDYASRVKPEPIDISDDEANEIGLWVFTLSQQSNSRFSPSPVLGDTSGRSEEAANESTERLGEKSIEISGEAVSEFSKESSEKPVDKPAEKAVDKSAPKTTYKERDKQWEETVEKPPEKSASKSKGKSWVKPSNRPAETFKQAASKDKPTDKRVQRFVVSIEGDSDASDAVNVPLEEPSPLLSQPFVNEIEGVDPDDAEEPEEEPEHEETMEEKNARLEHLKKTIKAKENRVQLIEPLHMDPYIRGATNSRFTLATASSGLDKDAPGSSGLNRRLSVPPPRQAKFIPSGSDPTRRRRSTVKKSTSFRERAKKAGGMDGYAASIKALEKIKPKPTPSEKTLAAAISAPVEAPPVEKIAAPTKVKQVKKSRGELLLEEQLKASEGPSKKRPLPENQKSTPFTIPKKKKEDDRSAEKRNNAVLISPPQGASNSFGAALNRVAGPPAKRVAFASRKFTASTSAEAQGNGHRNSVDEVAPAQPPEESAPAEPPKKPKKSISFAEKEDIRYIEPRPSPPPPLELALVPCHARQPSHPPQYPPPHPPPHPSYHMPQHPPVRQMENNRRIDWASYSGDHSHGGYPERPRDPRLRDPQAANGNVPPPPPTHVPNQRPSVIGSSRDPRSTRFFHVTSETSQTELNNRFRYDMLMRILRWNPKWIDEKKTMDKMPPLLAADSNYKLVEELQLQQVASAYRNLEAYYDVYHPLMLLELFVNICNDVSEKSITKQWPMVMFSEAEDFNMEKEDQPFFVRVKCQIIDKLVPSIGDLMSVTFSHSKGDSTHFGLVEKGPRSDPNIPPDSRLTKNPNQKAVVFYLRMRESSLPRGTQRKGVMHMKKVSNLHTFLRQFQVQASLVKSPLRDIILKPEPSAFQLRTYNRMVGDSLNESQMSSMMSITETMIATPTWSPKISLLQGPPGTGKSHVIVQMILHMLRRFRQEKGRSPRILFCAPSNAAVDEVAFRLKEERDRKKETLLIVRIGVPSSIHPKINELTLDELTKQWIGQLAREASGTSKLETAICTSRDELRHTKFSIDNLREQVEAQQQVEGSEDEVARLRRKITELEKKAQAVQEQLDDQTKKLTKELQAKTPQYKEDLVKNANVICTTLNSCCNTTMETVFLRKPNNPNYQPFFCCIIDEASQCTEPESLMPLFYRINKVVLVGDPEQLPATVCSVDALRNRFDQSLFNRLYSYLISDRDNCKDAVQMLDVQYRMHPEICRWPSKYFYGNKLVTAPTVLRDGPLHPYRVFNITDSKEQIFNKQIGNSREVDFICKLLEAILLCSEMEKKSIGIITFYRKQRLLIDEEVRRRSLKRKNIIINTVDGFQGQERDIIILSCVRQNANKNIGFMEMTQRLNVALTRARECLYVCGHINTLRFSDGWKSLVEDAISRQVICSVSSVYPVDTLYDILLKVPTN